jgi:6-pyruvoyltetrahydropterin/6-carboxytetrahydropterin synthase
VYRLAITRDFIAQHYLIGADWGAENFKHSHHYKVQVVLRGAALNQHGYLVDIVELENALTKIVDQFSDHTLNDLARFADLNPSLERFARVFYEDLHAKLALKDLSLAVKLWENERDWAAYGLE